MRQPVAWITVNGQHVPIYNGETKAMAIQNWLANQDRTVKDEEKKEKQIEQNKQEAEQKNAEEPVLPRRLRLENISAEKANKTTDVLVLSKDLDSVNYRGRRRFKFKAGTEIREVEVFAGAGTSKEFRDAAKYAERYGGDAKDWQHCSGDAIITNGRVTLRREVHWVQGKDGKMREAFIKVKH